MALAHDSSTPVRWTGTPANSVNITSASFTPSNGALLVVNVQADVIAVSLVGGITVSDSTGRTWTPRKEQPGAGNNGFAGVYTAIANGSAMTVSVQRTTGGTGGATRISATCDVWTGQHATPTGNTGGGTSATNNLTAAAYSSSADNSRCIGGATDWNQLGTPTSTDTEDGADYTGQISVISVYKAADTTPSGTAVTLNFDAGGTAAAAWSWVALEIIPAAGAAQDTPELRGRPEGLRGQNQMQQLLAT